MTNTSPGTGRRLAQRSVGIKVATAGLVGVLLCLATFSTALPAKAVTDRCREFDPLAEEVAGGSAPICQVLITTSGTWVAPPWLHSVDVLVVGGGGGGGGAYMAAQGVMTGVNSYGGENRDWAGGGGGGGGSVTSYINVPVSGSYVVTIGSGGQGGIGGTSPTNGSAGQPSAFGVELDDPETPPGVLDTALISASGGAGGGGATVVLDGNGVATATLGGQGGASAYTVTSDPNSDSTVQLGTVAGQIHSPDSADSYFDATTSVVGLFGGAGAGAGNFSPGGRDYLLTRTAAGPGAAPGNSAIHGLFEQGTFGSGQTLPYEASGPGGGGGSWSRLTLSWGAVPEWTCDAGITTAGAPGEGDGGHGDVIKFDNSNSARDAQPGDPGTGGGGGGGAVWCLLEGYPAPEVSPGSYNLSTPAVTVLGTGNGASGGSGLVVLRYSLPPLSTVFYDANGGTGTPPNPFQLPEGLSFTAASSDWASNPGMYVDHWNTMPDDSGTRVAVGGSYVMGLNSVILYAQWLPIPPPAAPAPAPAASAPVHVTPSPVPAPVAPPETVVTVISGNARVTVRFDELSTSLSRATKNALRDLVSGRIRNINRTVINGYVQEDGVLSNNDSLSKARAKKVAAFLRKIGVKGRIEAHGRGVAPEAGAGGRKSAVVVRYTQTVTSPRAT